MLNIPGSICANCGEYVPPEQKECPRCHAVVSDEATFAGAQTTPTYPPAPDQSRVSAPPVAYPATAYPPTGYPPVGYPSAGAYPPAGYPPMGAYPPYYPAPQKRASRKKLAFFITAGVLAGLLLIGSLCFFVYGQISALTTPTLAAPTGTPSFTDDFNDNLNNWWVGDHSGYGAAIANHALTLHEGIGKNFLEYIPTSKNWSDYRLDLTYTLRKGEPAENWISIGFHNQEIDGSNLYQGYKIIIFNNGHYYLHKVSPGINAQGFVTLAQGFMLVPPSSGSSTRVTLITKGDSMSVYINGVLSVSYTDKDAPFTDGHADLIVGNQAGNDPEVVDFTHVDIYASARTNHNK